MTPEKRAMIKKIEPLMNEINTLMYIRDELKKHANNIQRMVTHKRKKLDKLFKIYKGME